MATGRVGAKWAQTITMLTMIGTHRNIPAMPQMLPHTASETTMTTGPG